MVGPWIIDSVNSYRDLRTGNQHIGNWASRVGYPKEASIYLSYSLDSLKGVS